MRYILWSGGFDSTYLLCKRARENKEEIQPVYLRINGKASASKEIEKTKTILPVLRGKPECIASISDPVVIEEDSLAKSKEEQAAYERVKKQFDLAYFPFLWLMGMVAKQYPGIEIGIEAPAPGTRAVGRIEKFMTDNGLKLDNEGKITPGIGNADVLTVFGNFTFPLLHITGAEELEDFKTWGWEDIAKSTITCATGKERACGVCANCETKLKYGDTFAWMFDDQAKKDHAIKTYLSSLSSKSWLTYSTCFMYYVTAGNVFIPGTCRNGNNTINIGEESAKEITSYFNTLEEKWPDVDGLTPPEIKEEP